MVVSEKFDEIFREVGKSRVFITGCTHFGHRNIIRFERDSFATIGEHDDFIIDLINKSVGKNDILIHLGDVGNPSFMNMVNCKNTFLIKGNHDTLPNSVYDSHFSQVFNHPIYIWKRILLSHEPQIKSSEVLNVHAHLHNSIMNEQDIFRNYLNVGIHMSGYTFNNGGISKDDYKLFKLSDIIKIIGSIPTVSKKFPYEEYASSYKYIKHLDGIALNDDMTIDLEETKRLKAINNK